MESSTRPHLFIIGSFPSGFARMACRNTLAAQLHTLHAKMAESEESVLSFTGVMTIDEKKVLGQLTTQTLTLSARDIPCSIDRDRYDVDPRTLDPSSSYYIPPYFAVFGSSRPLTERKIIPQRSKVMKNARPKSTHSNRKFYR